MGGREGWPAIGVLVSVLRETSGHMCVSVSSMVVSMASMAFVVSSSVAFVVSSSVASVVFLR